MHLTEEAVDAAQPRERNYKLFDTRGLHLEVSKAGGKWWRLKYRFDGKEKRISLGVYPDVSLGEARRRRDEYRRLRANGIDPSVYKKQKTISSGNIERTPMADIETSQEIEKAKRALLESIINDSDDHERIVNNVVAATHYLLSSVVFITFFEFDKSDAENLAKGREIFEAYCDLLKEAPLNSFVSGVYKLIRQGRLNLETEST